MKFVGRLMLVGVSAAFAVVLWLFVDFLVLSHFLTDFDRANIGIIQGQDDGWYTLRPNLDHALAGWGKSFYPVNSDMHGFRIGAGGPSQRLAEVLFLGDSFAYGINGPWAETFVGTFEAETGAAVVNAGLSSYSPTAYAYQYQRALLAKALNRTHAVIVALDVSDVQDEAAIWEDGAVHPVKMATAPRNVATPVVTRSPARTFVVSNLLGTRRIYRFFRDDLVEEVANGKGGKAKDLGSIEFEFSQRRSAFTWRKWSEIEAGDALREDPFERVAYQPLGVAGGLSRIRTKLHVISDLATRNGGEVWMVIYPWPAQLRYGQAVFDWEQFARDLCAEIKCRGLVDVFPRFRAEARVHADWYSRYFVVGDVHFNALANRMVAEEVAKALAHAKVASGSH